MTEILKYAQKVVENFEKLGRVDFKYLSWYSSKNNSATFFYCTRNYMVDSSMSIDNFVADLFVPWQF